MTEKPTYTANSLFRSGPNAQLNACVGENGGPYGYDEYGDGFFDGAKMIVNRIKEGAYNIDTLIYPATFSYRHGIELYAKHLVKKLAAYNKSGADTVKTHALKDNWALLVKEATNSKLKFFDPLEVSIAGDIIEDFCEIDPTGQVLRYPEDVKNNLHLTGLGVINVEILADGMQVLEDLFDRWLEGFREMEDAV